MRISGAMSRTAGSDVSSTSSLSPGAIRIYYRSQVSAKVPIFSSGAPFKHLPMFCYIFSTWHPCWTSCSRHLSRSCDAQLSEAIFFGDPFAIPCLHSPALWQKNLADSLAYDPSLALAGKKVPSKSKRVSDLPGGTVSVCFGTCFLIDASSLHFDLGKKSPRCTQVVEFVCV